MEYTSKRKKHDIPPDVLNENLQYCINQYIRCVEHRKMLRDWWFHNYTLQELSFKYHCSLTTAKNIVYNQGDPILIRASKMK